MMQTLKLELKQYVKSLNWHWMHGCEIGNITFHDEYLKWVLPLLAPSNYCPCKSGSCNNKSHNASIEIGIEWCNVKCFRSTTDPNSRCAQIAKSNAWRLPNDKSKQFFKSYRDSYKETYGIDYDEEKLSASDDFLAKLFMHRKGKTMTYCNGKLYARNEYGIYKVPAQTMKKLRKAFGKNDPE